MFIFGLLCSLLAVSAARAQNQNTQYDISETEKKQVVELVGRRLVDFYIYPDVAREMSAAISKNLEDGVYRPIEDSRDFAARLTRDLQAISRDGHLEVWFDPQLIIENKKAASKRKQESAEVLQKRIKEAQKDNFGFKEVKILEGNIGYLNLTRFYDTKDGG
jgi:hypothetical protein